MGKFVHRQVAREPQAQPKTEEERQPLEEAQCREKGKDENWEGKLERKNGQKNGLSQRRLRRGLVKPTKNLKTQKHINAKSLT